MARKPTQKQEAVLRLVYDLGRPAKRCDVVDRRDPLLPDTEGSARDRLESCVKHGWMRRLDGSPARYLVTGDYLAEAARLAREEDGDG